MNDPVRIRLRRLSESARVPEFAHGPTEDAGLDIFAAENVTIPPGAWTAVRTGLAIELPAGYEAQIRPRSGLAARAGVTLLNSPGTIDPGYRGEIRVLMINHGPSSHVIQRGDRIAQMVVGRYAAPVWETVEELAESLRGDGGFGSTGR